METDLKLLRRQILSGDHEYSIAEALHLVSEILKHPPMTGERFHNSFFHEFAPLVSLALYVGNDETRIAYTGTTIGVDGHLLLGPARCRRKVEFTAAVDGANEALRMELAAKRGAAPATGKIEASGSKHKRLFGANCTLGGRADRHDPELLELMKKCIASKQEKAGSRPDYKDAWLGVVLEDYPPGHLQKKKRFDPLCILALAQPFEPFSRVFFIAVGGDYLFDSERIKASSANPS